MRSGVEVEAKKEREREEAKVSAQSRLVELGARAGDSGGFLGCSRTSATWTRGGDWKVRPARPKQQLESDWAGQQVQPFLPTSSRLNLCALSAPSRPTGWLSTGWYNYFSI